MAVQKLQNKIVTHAMGDRLLRALSEYKAGAGPQEQSETNPYHNVVFISRRRREEVCIHLQEAVYVEDVFVKGGNRQDGDLPG
jgi:hypothetical protein